MITDQGEIRMSRVVKLLQDFKKRRKMSGITKAGMIFNQSRQVFQHLTSFFDMEKMFKMIRDETVFKPILKIGKQKKKKSNKF
jgi:hypothetical protein